jgi:uncharacterized DUF497 family protein
MCHGHPTLSLSCHPPTAAGVCAGNGTLILNGGQFQFEWNEIKAASNLMIRDSLLLPTWNTAKTRSAGFRLAWRSNGAMLSIAYLWSEGDFATTKIRIISARATTQTEIHYYEESL